MTSRCQSFFEVRYTNEFLGYPCIAAASQNEVIVGDWSGNLLRATLSPFVVIKKVFAASKIGADIVVCNTLRSLALVTEDPLRCAVATAIPGELAVLRRPLEREDIRPTGHGCIRVDRQGGENVSVFWTVTSGGKHHEIRVHDGTSRIHLAQRRMKG